MDQLEHIKQYFKNYFNLNFDEEKEKTIEIDGIVFPNFYHYQYLNIGSDIYNYIKFEFCRILYKIFGEQYLQNKLSYYECTNGKIQTGNIVFDCGSNLGIFAAYAASKGAKVYCFEPSTYTRHYLQITQQLYPNIIIVPYGISDQNQYAYFRQYDNPAASRIITQDNLSHHYVLYQDIVELVSIDNFCNKSQVYPNFIKMDIEGSEIEGLMGGINIINKYKPIISFCIHDNNMEQINILKQYFSSYNFNQNKRQFFDQVLIGVHNINVK